MSIEVRKLSNGIPVLMDNIDSINTISLGIFVKTGSRDEYPEESGVSHYIEHMMFKGTTNRTAKDISEEVDNEGGMINAYTSRDTTCYYIQMLSNKIEKGVEILYRYDLPTLLLQRKILKKREM